MRRKRIFTFLTDILFYMAGGFIYSTAVLLFLSENGISPGGLTGIATILNYLFSLPIGAVVFVLNIPLLAAAFIKFGGIFIAKTAVATAIMSLMLDISGLFLPTIKIDPILAALFGGLLMGLGISLFTTRSKAPRLRPKRLPALREHPEGQRFPLRSSRSASPTENASSPQ